jgi:hypothetical protein
MQDISTLPLSMLIYEEMKLCIAIAYAIFTCRYNTRRRHAMMWKKKIPRSFKNLMR